MKKVRLPSPEIQDCYLKKKISKYVIKHVFGFYFRYGSKRSVIRGRELPIAFYMFRIKATLLQCFPGP